MCCPRFRKKLRTRISKQSHFQYEYQKLTLILRGMPERHLERYLQYILGKMFKPSTISTNDERLKGVIAEKWCWADCLEVRIL